LDEPTSYSALWGVPPSRSSVARNDSRGSAFGPAKISPIGPPPQTLPQSSQSMPEQPPGSAR
jgi:hypothetical protein